MDYLRLVSVVPENDVNSTRPMPADFSCPGAITCSRRLSGFFSNLELAILVADSPGWFSLSLEPRLPDFKGVASHTMMATTAVSPMSNDNGDDGCHGPVFPGIHTPFGDSDLISFFLLG